MVNVLFTEDEYSDYAVLGLFEVESYTWVNARLKDYLDEKGAEPYRFDAGDFVKFLQSKGAREIDYREGWLGGYGNAPPQVFDQGLLDKGVL